MLQLTISYLLLVMFFMLEFFLRKDKTAKSIDKSDADNKSTYLIGITFFIVLILSVVLNLLHIGNFNNNNLSFIGLILMCAGIIIRIWSMQTLKKYYTRTLITAEHQKIISKGPYKIIRHPGYLGTILIWGFAGLAMQNLIIFIVSVSMIFIAYFYRISNEERMLAEKFGKEFIDYKKHTWRLLPPVW